MGIFDFFKNRENGLKDTTKIEKDYSSNEPNLEHQVNELKDSINEYRKQEELKRKKSDEYYLLYQKAITLKKDGKIDEALEMFYKIINKYSPEGKVYYDEPASILEKKGEISEAIRILNLGVKNNYNNMKDYFLKSIHSLEDKLNLIGDERIYKECLKMFTMARSLEKNNEIDEALKIYYRILKYNCGDVRFFERPAIILENKRKLEEALKIFLNGKNKFLNTKDEFYFDNRINRIQNKLNPKSINIETKIIEKSSINKKNTNLESQEIFSKWHISISFGKSTSNNYTKAVFLAKKAPYYHEEGEGKNIIHQATYSSLASDYLSFITLYELVGGWKSSFVFINNQLIDRKIVGKLNYCYGDKCRSGNTKFCYGASQFTANPFGCHRLQISEYNSPWWSFGMLDTKNIWHVDKKAILERINEKCVPYKSCPNFSYDNIILALNKLPDTIDVKKDKNWEIIGDTICPKNYRSLGGVTIKIDI